MRNCSRPVTALLVLAAAGAVAGEAPGEPRLGPVGPASGPTGGPGGGPTGAPISELSPGRTALGAGRQVIVQGQLDLDVLQRDNYTDSDTDLSDHRGYGQMRAELGLKLKLDERATVAIGFGYKADMGDYGTTNQRPGAVNPGPDGSQVKSDQAQVVMKDAYVNLKEFLGFEEMGVIVGRMPVSWNLVSERGAFLFDSRSDDPVIGSWDGVRASYSGFDALVISPWVYRLPEASTLLGLTIDWKPATAGGDKVFITGSIVEQLEPVVGSTRNGDNLRTYAVGFDWRIGEVGLWGEGAAQTGDAANGGEFEGYGGELGFDWQFSQYGKGRFQVIGGYMTGDDTATTDSYEGFVNSWETIGDTLIVENEKYGELSRLVIGNLQSLKVRWGVGFDERDRVRIDLTGAHYRLSEPVQAGGSTDFANELDVALRWQYTTNAQIRLFAAGLVGGDGLKQAQEAAAVAAGKTLTAGDDAIWLAGANLNVSF
jgi:hypothetical protein